MRSVRPVRPSVPLSLVLVLVASAACAGGMNRTYLVPAVTQCPGPATCQPREFESAYTFDAIILRSPATKFLQPGKPSLRLDIRGVRDPSHALVNGTVTVRILAGRVSLASFGTFPDASPLTQQAPIPVTLHNGRRTVSYMSSTPVPNGTITNGGGVEVLDPEGHRMAVTGSQARP